MTGLLNNAAVWIFTSFVATKLSDLIWKKVGDAKAMGKLKATGEIEIVTKRWPIVGLIINEAITKAKTLYGQDDLDSVVMWASEYTKKAIPGIWDDIVIDLLVKRYVSQRKITTGTLETKIDTTVLSSEDKIKLGLGSD